MSMRKYDFNSQLASSQSSHIPLVRVWTHVFCASYTVATTFRN